MTPSSLQVREHGRPEARPVILVHGGPGTPGTMAPLARRLGGSFRVLEPYQRRSGAEPLTVARHVADLHEVVTRCCEGERPALVGHSWGAMLALAYGAAHPEQPGRIALIGCGTFDEAARARLQATRQGRMTAALRRRLEGLPEQIADPDQRLLAAGRLLLPVDSCDLVRADMAVADCDARGHHESWSDMLRLQEAGAYPAAFASIQAPVLMLHGADDPHPGEAIAASLRPHLRQLVYAEFPRCGHYPWLERRGGDALLARLGAWLRETPP